jgi:hypothetical protein
MAGGWPIGFGLANGYDYGSVTTTTIGTLVTGGSANTKGSYSQLTGATTYDACWIVVTITPASAAAYEYQGGIDIAIGASGSENLLINNLMAWNDGYYCSCVRYAFPCQIPAGTRVAARCQSAQASNTYAVSITLFDGDFVQMEGSASIDSYGFLTASSQGTAVTASATANAKGSYAQLTAATSYDLMGFALGFDTQGAAPTNAYMFVDIAVGPAGSEQVICSNIPIMSGSANPLTNTEFIPIQIPAGTRIAARASSSTGSTVAGISLMGVRQ